VGIEILVVGGVAEGERERVGEEVRRAVGGRLDGWGCGQVKVQTPAIAFTNAVFEGARDFVAAKAGVAESEVVSAAESEYPSFLCF
jgi:hypothetical protein